jgi:predicted transcriptional regulator
MPPVEIAAAIGMTPSGVRRIINQQKATEAKVLALSLEGVAPAEIAHQLGLSESDVSAILSVDQK